MILALLVAFVLSLALAKAAGPADLPMLEVGGFSWAENLVFDGNGGLFASEYHRGELIRIQLCEDGASYCQAVHLSGFDNLGAHTHDQILPLVLMVCISAKRRVAWTLILQYKSHY